MRLMRDVFKQAYINAHNAKDIDPNLDMANYLVDRMEYNRDQVIWFCFLNAITYHLPTSFIIMNEYPDLEVAGIERLKEWWTPEVQKRCPYQKDKMKQRKFLPETIESYKNVVGQSQTFYFINLLQYDPATNFRLLWDEFYVPIRHFGRFSVWNFAQMLKSVAKFDIEPDTFFLGTPNAKSITKGARYLFGDLPPEQLEECTFNLMKEISLDVPIDAFKMETELCRFHKYYRERESRYIGYYLDRQAEDIRACERQGWDGICWRLLHESREETLEKQYVRHNISKDYFKLHPEQKMGIQKIGLF